MGHAKILNGNFPGMRLFHFQDFFLEDRIKDDPSQNVWNNEKLANWTHIFHSEIPFGNFGQPLKKYCFPKKISVWENKINLSIYISSAFEISMGKW